MDHPKDTLLSIPQKWLTADLNNYLTVLRLNIEGSTPHYLEDDSVLFFVNSGKGHIIINGCYFEMKEGTFCYIHNYNTYRIESDYSNPLELIACVYDYSLATYVPFPLLLEPEAYNSTFYHLPVIQTEAKDRAHIKRLFSQLEYPSSDLFSGVKMMKASIIAQMGVVFRRLLHQQHNNGLPPYEFPIGWKIWIYLTKYSGLKLIDQTVADLFGITVNSMNRELRAISGYNFKQLLSRAKISNACSAILMEECSLNYLSRYVGFTSESTFYRAFVKYRGMLPSEYREFITSKDIPSCRAVKCNLNNALYLYVLNNYQNHITISDTAKIFYLNEETINSELKAGCGMTFSELLNNFRIEYSVSLLCCSEMRILDIAFKSGFDSVYTFIRQFKAIKKMTPSEFRTKYKGKTIL